MGELAYGDRLFEVNHVNNPPDLPLRTSHELFPRENILNTRRIGNMEPGSTPIFLMTRHDSALEAIHQLRDLDFVQLFSSYADLSGKNYGTHRYAAGSSQRRLRLQLH
jgi:hypothetical protein